MIWHSCDTAEAIAELSSSRDAGLESAEVMSRLQKYGKNELHNLEAPSFWRILLKRIGDVYTIVLFGLSLIFFIIALFSEAISPAEPSLILAAVIINCFAGAYVVFRNAVKVDRLRNSHKFYSKVIRDGVEQLIPSENLVPGDVMLLSSGDYIAADGRIIDSYVFICNELSITGLDVPIEKMSDRLLEDITPLPDRLNMVYSGSYVVSGKAAVLVTETGDETAVGRAEAIKKQTSFDTTPLNTRLQNIEKIFRLICLVFAVLIFCAGVIANIRNYDISFGITVLYYLLFGSTLVVSGIPNGLPTIFTTAVSFAAQRLRGRNLTFLNLPSAEAIGDTTVICTDKTGVLTDDNNNLVKVWGGKDIINLSKDKLGEAEIMLLHLALICSNLNENEHLERHSNAIELAIERGSINSTGMSKADINGIYPRLAELPFDSSRMLMTTVTVINTKPYAVIKGAPEAVLSRCTDQNQQRAIETLDAFADEGLKVLAVALKPLSEIPANPSMQELENGLIFVGLLGFDNPTEPACIREIAECKRKNIRVVMITGDYKKTSVAVGRELGIINGPDEALEHNELILLSDDELCERVTTCSVFARASAEDKHRIVRALQSNGERVLLTSDSVSDLPAVNVANFSAALGATSAESVKVAADFIVDDNKFTTLTLALKESNRIFDSVLRNLKYMICCSAAQIAALLFGIIIFGTAPISISALIWFNMIINILPTLAFSWEPESQTLSLRRHESRHLLSLKSCIGIAVPVLIITILSLVGFGISLKSEVTSAFALGFAVLSICLIIHAFTLSHTYTVFQKGTVRNLVMPIACLISLLLVILIAFTPVGGLFSLSAPDGIGFIFLLISAIATIATGETVKFINKKI